MKQQIFQNSNPLGFIDRAVFNLYAPDSVIPFTKLVTLNNGANDIDFEAPEGYHVVLTSMLYRNYTLNTATVQNAIRRGSENFRVLQASLTVNASSFLNTPSLDILDETVILRETLTNTTSIEARYNGYFIKSDRVKCFYISPTTTITELYEVPDGIKRAVIFGQGLSTPTAGSLSAFNSSGGSVTMSFYHVPASGSPDSSNLIWSVSPSNGGAGSTVVLPMVLYIGESIHIVSTSDNAGQTFKMYVLEYPE